jgi:hypothetical protein
MNTLRILHAAVSEAYDKKDITKDAYLTLDCVIRRALGIHEDVVGSVKTKMDGRK